MTFGIKIAFIKVVLIVFVNTIKQQKQEAHYMKENRFPIRLFYAGIVILVALTVTSITGITISKCLDVDNEEEICEPTAVDTKKNPADYTLKDFAKIAVSNYKK